MIYLNYEGVMNMKYRCKICGSVINEKVNSSCPMCYADASFLEEYRDIEEQPQVFQKAVQISDNNLGIERDNAKCIDCGQCKETCMERTGLDFGSDTEKCLSCGQCVLTCPTGALKVKKELDHVLKAKDEGKILICYTSPAIRVSIGEEFGLKPGTFCLEELVGSLKALGFTYVFDTTFGADLTIIEEASELKSRLLNHGVLPMMTSCCPAWVKYAKDNMPEILDHISTCKSPIGMQGEIIKTYFCEKKRLDQTEVYTVAITPCTAKKMETKETNIPGTDAVLTVTELAEWMKKEQIDFKNISKSTFDTMFQEGSGGGTLFGVTGGVTESALRTFYYLMTHEEFTEDLMPIHSLQNVKEYTLDVGEYTVQVAVVHELSKAKKILEDVCLGKSPYHFIEIMNCEGGCVGGGGQPKYVLENESEVKKERIHGLMNRDQTISVHAAHHNPDIKRIYEEFLKVPNESIAKKHLHREEESKV